MFPIYVYIFLPILIFFLGWLKPYIGIPAAAVLLFCMYRLFVQCKKEKTLGVEIKYLSLGSVLAAGVLAWISGAGAFGIQNEEHALYNAVLRLLIEGTGDKTLSYDIGFYLPAALAGKLFGRLAGEIVLLGWTFLGVVIVFYLIAKVTGKDKFWTVVLFALFGGLDIVGVLLVKGTLADTPITAYIEDWAGFFEFWGFTPALLHGFDTCISAWIITLLLILQKDNKNVVFLWAAAIFMCPLPAVGMMPFVVLKLLKGRITDTGFFEKTPPEVCDKKTVTENLKEAVTLNNILGGLVVGILSAVYVFSRHVSLTFGIGRQRYMGVFFGTWMVFVLLEVGAYLWVMWKDNRKKTVYLVLLFTLALLPLFRLGDTAEFGTEAAYPALLILFLMVLQTLENMHKTKEWLLLVILSVLLGIGVISSVKEMARTYNLARERLYTKVSVRQDELSERKLTKLGVLEDSGDSFFGRYLER